MTIETNSPRVQDARKTCLELLLSDHAGSCESPCNLGCPAGVDVAAMIRLVEKGQPAEALELVLSANPLPGSLGRVCPAFCEGACRRGEKDGAVRIRDLEKHVGDFQAPPTPMKENESGPDSTRSVCVVGAGPAGLAAAASLRRLGHRVTILESSDAPGGAFRHVIPSFRLPDSVLSQDVERILGMGIELRCGIALGRDVSLAELREGYDAVLLAMGAPNAVPPVFEGSRFGVSALTFLRRHKRGDQHTVGSRVVVLGGNIEAVDVARVARAMGKPDTRIIFGSSRSRMSAPPEEIRSAQAEGVLLECDAVSLKIVRTDRETLMVEREGREPLEASLVLVCGNRQGDLSLLQEQGLSVTKTGPIADRTAMTSSMDGVFVAGEVLTGSSFGARAIASGQAAARSIARFLCGETLEIQPKTFDSRRGRLSKPEFTAILDRFLPAALRAENPLTPLDPAQEVARCQFCDCTKKHSCRLRDLASEYQARQWTFKGERRQTTWDDSHDLIVFESGKCILCGLCIQVAAQSNEKRGLALRGRGFSTQVGPAFADQIRDALQETPLKCASVCPTGALAHKPRGHRAR